MGGPVEHDEGGAGQWQPHKRRLLHALRAQGITSEAVLSAMERVERHLFVPPALQPRAYENVPLPIGQEQTISQPYIVALMTELAQVTPNDRVLVIGTGSGYQDAVLAELVHSVFSVERILSLAEVGTQRLRALGYDNVHVRVGDGNAGWHEEAPFAAIVVTAAAPEVPQALIDQLAPGGRLVIPVAQGRGHQHLRVLVREPHGIVDHDVVPVVFVPLLPGTALHV